MPDTRLPTHLIGATRVAASNRHPNRSRQTALPLLLPAWDTQSENAN